jgi:hypothetical protein
MSQMSHVIARKGGRLAANHFKFNYPSICLYYYTSNPYSSSLISRSPMAMEMDPDDPYRPEKYRCTGYDLGNYEWFSGLSRAKDQRFLIDLECGTMDK